MSSLSLKRMSFNRDLLNSIFLITLELSKEQKKSLSNSKRISNPGCYPTGFIGLVRPLVDSGILPVGTPLTVNAISGYSGGGKDLMEIFENDVPNEPFGAYGFSLVSLMLSDIFLHQIRMPFPSNKFCCFWL